MIVLGLDTAANACSAAVWDDGGVVAHECLHMARGHTEALIPMVRRVLAAAAAGFRDVDLVAVTVGPGAFTGLRVGLAAARGIALAAKVPCIGVTTLEAIAAAVPRPARDGLPEKRIVLVALDTRRGDFYAQAFSAQGTGLAVPRVVDAAGLPDLVTAGEALVAGDARAAAVAELRCAGIAAEFVAGSDHPDAGVVAAMAAARFQAGDFDPEPPLPLYVRRPEATIAADGGRRRA
jgi:tRNA threonylcarbamoyladenosine biosynthesis protein TsaB